MHIQSTNLDVHGLAQADQRLACRRVQVCELAQLLVSHSLQCVRRGRAQPVNGAAVDKGGVGPQALPVFNTRQQPHNTCWVRTLHEMTVSAASQRARLVAYTSQPHLQASPMGLMHSTMCRLRLQADTK